MFSDDVGAMICSVKRTTASFDDSTHGDDSNGEMAFAVVEDRDIGSSTNVNAEREEDNSEQSVVDDDEESRAVEGRQILRASSCWKETTNTVCGPTDYEYRLWTGSRG